MLARRTCQVVRFMIVLILVEVVEKEEGVEMVEEVEIG